MSDWRHDLLKMIGAKPTPGNLRFLKTWQRWEGGHTNNDARYNWLNTTMDAPGSTGEINSVGVKAFGTQREGVNALAITLLNGRYNDIVRGLRSGRPFTQDLSAGLSTWVSGSPTGNLSYAQKIMGTAAGDPKGPSTRARPEPIRKAGSLPGPDPMAGINVAFADDPEFLNLFNSLGLFQPEEEPVKVRSPKESSRPVKAGRGIQIPRKWKGTHVTSGLGWDTGTAEDIMGAPGTPVSLSEDVTVVYYHPNGAQGGDSMLVRTKSGREYWLGHVASGRPAGSRIRAGESLAVISADHPRPHVHVDRRG